MDLNIGVDASEDTSEVGVGYQGGSVTWVLDLRRDAVLRIRFLGNVEGARPPPRSHIKVTLTLPLVVLQDLWEIKA